MSLSQQPNLTGALPPAQLEMLKVRGVLGIGHGGPAG